jgi:hypothetical protein
MQVEVWWEYCLSFLVARTKLGHDKNSIII